MGKFSGVLIATDMDGTLLCRDGTISPRNRSAIDAFIREGGHFTVATGRSALGFERVRPTVPFNAPCVLSNGAVLFDYTENRPLSVKTIEGDYIAAVRDTLTRFPGVGVEFHQVKRKFALHRNSYINGHFAHVGCEGTDIAAPEDAGGDIVKVLFVDDPKLLIILAEDFRRTYGKAFQMQFSCPIMAELQNHGTDKGEGVAALAKLLGVREERVFTAGDERNDLSMLRRFCSFATANADEETKASANHSLPDCDADAIAHMIERIEAMLVPIDN